MAKKVKHPEHVNHERWLVSYADFITLLFAFFTVLYATSQTDTRKTQQLVGSVERAFSMGIFDSGSPQLMLTDKLGSATEGVYDLGITLASLERSVGDSLKDDPINSFMEVKKTSDGLLITLQTVAFFKPGSDELQPAASQALHRLTDQLKKTNYLLQINGHTDDVPFRNIYFGSNWELSVGRALTVLRILLQNGIDSQRLSIAGYADNRPVATNQTPEGRSKNRRVEILVLPKRLPDLKPAVKAGPLSEDLKRSFSVEAVSAETLATEKKSGPQGGH